MEILDPEDVREIPKDWREYLDHSKKMFDVFSWSLRELEKPETKKRYNQLLIALAFMTALQVVQSPILAAVFRGSEQRNLGLTIFGVGGFFFAMVLKQAASWRYAHVREYLLGDNQGKLDHVITERFFEKSPGQHIEENFRLNPESIFTGRERLLNLQGIILFDTLGVIAALACSYVFIWFYSGVGGVIGTITLLVCILWMLYLNRAVIEECTPLEAEFRALKRYRIERLKNVERVQICNKEAEELKIMDDKFDAAITKDLKFWLWFIKHCFYREVIGALGLTAILGYGASLVYNREWSIMQLFPLIAWSTAVIENIWRIGHNERQINWNIPGVRSMITALSIPPAIVPSDNDVILPDNEPVTISFEEIGHSYPLEKEEELDDENGGGPAADGNGSSPVLKNVSFTIRPGEIVGVIGPSGAGKSTLAKLLMRFMDPEHGSIHINGIDLRKIHLGSWRQKLAYIPQNAQIIDGDLAYNLKYGLPPEAHAAWTDDRLWKLMRSLCIDFGKRLNKGLKTRVGERGMKLSGGQAQRVMIGAAAIQSPQVMVIDEATSHLDSHTEQLVHEGLRHVLVSGVSAFIIAHRLSTVRDLCHIFVVLKDPNKVRNGDSQIEAIGRSFEELYEISPQFRLLADAQGLKI